MGWTPLVEYLGKDRRFAALYQDTTRDVIRSTILFRCAFLSRIPLCECRTEAALDKETNHGFFRYENDRGGGQGRNATQTRKEGASVKRSKDQYQGIGKSGKMPKETQNNREAPNHGAKTACLRDRRSQRAQRRASQN